MKKYFLALLFFSLIALAASISMTHLHYEIASKGLSEKSFCHVSEFFDCDTAMVSRFAKIGPFLTSEFGILYYLLVTLGILYAWASEANRRSALSFLFMASLPALVYSLVLAYLSVKDLGVLCLLCMTTYISNLALVLLFPRALKFRYQSIPSFIVDYIKSVFCADEFKTRVPLYLSVTILFVAAGLLFFRGINPEIRKANAQIPKDVYLKSFYELPRLEIHLPDRPTWGAKDGKIEIAEFSDFQCPHCRRAAFALKPYLKEFRNDVRLVFLNFPLDNMCNPSVSHSMHPVSCIAAKGGICAYHMGKFWDYQDLVFERQRKLSRSTILEIADEVGLNPQVFEQCLTSDQTTARLKEDVDEGRRVHVEGTPAVYLNGRPLRDWVQPELLRMVIESELRTH